MSELLNVAKKIAAPVSGFRRIVVINVVYRVSIMVTGLLVARLFWRITEAVASHAPFHDVAVLGILAFLTVGANLVMLFVMVGLKAGYPNLSVYASREIRRIVLNRHFSKEISIHAPTGKTLAIFENGITSWLNLALRITVEDPINIVSFLIGFSYLVYADAGMLPIALAYMLTVGIFSHHIRKKIRPFTEERRKAKENGGRVFVRAIMEKATALMNGALAYEESRLATASDAVVLATERQSRITVVAYRIPAYLLDAIRVVTALFFAYRASQWLASVADIVTASLVFGLLDKYFQGLLDSYQTYSEEFVTLGRLWDYLDSVPQFTHLTSWTAFVPGNGRISVQSVSYSYPGSEKPAISNFSLEFAAGKKTALVGRSGAGKSTLVKLLLGLLDPSEGRIVVDSQDLSGIRLDSYFPYVGYLAQEPSVFDGTIRENLAYGMSEVPEESRLLEALEHARCDFIEYMPHGLATEIGERGVRLSGWERQRLAIARIFLRNPEILVLDEPTSALDSFSESAITEALHRLFENKTVIVVAHRLQTVKEADKIVVLGSEGIIEQGNHETLLAANGEYSRMVDLQSGKILDETAESVA